MMLVQWYARGYDEAIKRIGRLPRYGSIPLHRGKQTR